jgi:hypothetical protein
MPDFDAKELAAELATALQHSTTGAVAFAEMRKDLVQAQKDILALQEVVFKQHEPVVIWSRNFMESYRRVITVIVTSGIITTIGLIIQLYSMLQKGK